MWKSVCRLVEILVGPVLLAVLLEIYKIVIMRTWTSRLSSIYGERWNSSHIPLPIYFWYICWLSSVGSAPWNILICNYAHRKMSNSYQNDQGSWPIFVRAWMVRLVSRSIFVCLLWLLFMTCHGRWWLSFFKGGGGSIRIPLLINCLKSYCLFTYTFFVQSKMTMILHIVGWYQSSLKRPKTIIRRRKPRKDMQYNDH